MSNNCKKNMFMHELSNVKIGDTFKIGDVEYIKFSDKDGVTTAVTKDIIFSSVFGDNDNLVKSKVLERLNNEFLPKVAKVIGAENICNITTDLTAFDGFKPYGTMTSKINLPTLDFYFANVEIFDEYKVNEWWWLATPESDKPHRVPDGILCVAPSGGHDVNIFSCYDTYFGVRPLLNFVSSIFVSCEE